MKTFNFTLNVQIQAHDEQEAFDIAKSFKVALLDRTISPYKVEDAEVDQVEEA